MNHSGTPEIYQCGSGDPLVLLHGFGSSWRQWKPLFPLLEPHYRVIAPTLPGHPGGLALKKRASPVTISEAFADQYRSLGIGPAHLVGQSMGGWIVFEMARFGLARSALGLSAAGAWSDEQVKVAFMRNALSTYRLLPLLLPLMKLAASSSAMRKRMLTGEMQHGDRVPATEVRDALNRVSLLTIAREYLDENVRPIEPLPADCKVPLGLAWGDQDKVLPFEQYGQPLVELLGLKSHLILKDCGHNPVYDDTEGVAKAILEFTRSASVGIC